MTASGTASRRIDPIPGLIATALVFCVYAGIAVSVDFSRAAFGFHSDEATYYMMAHSLATDGDLAYRREDLARVYREFPSGPSGVFLKKGRDLDVGVTDAFPFVAVSSKSDMDTAQLFYGKSYLYAMTAAPFVALFGTNGFLLLNAVLLAAMMLAGYLFLNARSSPVVAVLLASGFLMGSVAPAYYVWITPELLNLALVMLGYFCWLYKEVIDPGAAPRGTRWLLTGRSDLVAALLLGLATFSKPSHLPLILPILVWLVVRKRWKRMVAAACVFGLTGVILLAGSIAVTGEWNFQGGDRRTYYAQYPFQDNKIPWDAIGQDRATNRVEILFDRRVFGTLLSHNLFYFVAGRYSGMLPYYFPGLFAMGAFLLARRRRRPWQWLVLAVAVAEILLLIIWIPDNYFGGGGAVGNRYFMGAYGVFLFLLPPMESVLAALVPWVVGAIFSGALVLNPFFAAFNPAEHAKQGPVRLLPVELTLVNDLPINTRSERARVWFGTQRRFQIYFLDDNAYAREDLDFWTRGQSRAEILVKTVEPASGLELTVQAGPEPTTVTVARGWWKTRVALNAGETRAVTVPLDEGFPYQGTRVWCVSVSSDKGFVPAFVNAASEDRRFLGVRVTPEIKN
jgi:hypothetical protein